jgi:hypothetical protein
LASTSGGTTTTVTQTTTVTSDTAPLDATIAMTDDQSRPMRMLMSNRHDRGDINYDRAVDILCSGMTYLDRTVIQDVFHPLGTGGTSYTNEEALDAIVRLIQDNAMIVHYLDRYSWYNHFDPAYYTSGRYDWGY